MIETKPGKKYTIKLNDGSVISNAVRTRNVWNDSRTGKFLAYDQHVIDYETTFYCPKHGPELLWLSQFDDDNDYQIFCDYCGRVLTDTKPDYKAFEIEQVRQLEQKRRDRNANNNGYIEKVTYIRNHSKKRIHLEYKKIRDTYEYCIWRYDKTGKQVSKKQYDSFDLPERIVDNRF